MPNFQGAVNSAIGSIYRTKSIGKVVSQGESQLKTIKENQAALLKNIDERGQLIREFNAEYRPKAIPTEIAVAHSKRAREEGAEQERQNRQKTYMDRFNKLYGGDTDGTTPTA